MEEYVNLFIQQTFIKCYYVPGIVLSIAAMLKSAKIPCFASLKEI